MKKQTIYLMILIGSLFSVKTYASNGDYRKHAKLRRELSCINPESGINQYGDTPLHIMAEYCELFPQPVIDPYFFVRNYFGETSSDIIKDQLNRLPNHTRGHARCAAFLSKIEEMREACN